MKIASIASALLLVGATPALAQQPAVYPLRSQTAALQSVDSASCYAQAKRETGVNMARQSQRPQRTDPMRFGADAGRGASEPPLPAAASAPSGVSRAHKGALTTANAGEAPAAGGDTPPPAARAAAVASANGHSGQRLAQPSAAPGPASASIAASASASASASPSTSEVAGLPPLPPPLPPMASYWQAYGDCMQARGYGVQ